MFRCRGWRTLPMPPAPPGRSVPAQSYDALWVSSAQRGTLSRMHPNARVSYTSHKRPCCSQVAIFFLFFFPFFFLFIFPTTVVFPSITYIFDPAQWFWLIHVSFSLYIVVVIFRTPDDIYFFIKVTVNTKPVHDAKFVHATAFGISTRLQHRFDDMIIPRCKSFVNSIFTPGVNVKNY